MRLRLLAVMLALAVPVMGGVRLEVTAPADGEVLRGGSTATIAWEATAPLPAGVVEWEAFLSVDGGRYFATRITPHLDIDIRSFEFDVPNVASKDVRLLIRVGDEREEKSVDVPLRLSIVADPAVRPPLVRIAPGRGEPARPGDPGVAMWAAGDRGGRAVGQVRAPVDASLRRTSLKETQTIHVATEAPAAPSHRPSLAITATPHRAPRLRASAPLVARDILLLVRRRNL